MWTFGSAKRAVRGAISSQRRRLETTSPHLSYRIVDLRMASPLFLRDTAPAHHSHAVRLFTSHGSNDASEPRDKPKHRSNKSSFNNSPTFNYRHQRQLQQIQQKPRNGSDSHNNNNNRNSNIGGRQPDAAAIADLTSKLAALHRQISEAGLVANAPVWNLETITRPEDGFSLVHEQEQRRQELVSGISSAVDNLRHYVLDSNSVLRPSNKHRHEFTAIVERVLQLCLHCSSRDTQLFENHVAGLLQLLQHFQLEINHRQCHLAVQIAAREGQWERAAALYASHIDPAQGGYTPVVGSALETVTGLYCMARAAQQQQPGAGLAVERVLEGVLHLSLVSSSDTEKYVLAAGEALGHAGECEGLRDYLKSSYRASELGQPLVAATMHACILCGRHEEALAIFDELLCGELAASASEWQWGGGEDRLHPACRDLALRALGGCQGVNDGTDVRERALHLFRQALEEDAKLSVEALTAVVATCEVTGDWETIVDLFLTVLDKTPKSWLVTGEGVQLTLDKLESTLSNAELVAELGLFLNRVMQACNLSKKHGLALLCLQLFDSSLVSTVRVAAQDQSTENTMDTPHSLLSTIRYLRDQQDLVITTAVSLCGALSPHIAIDLKEAFMPEMVDPRHRYDCHAYSEHLQHISNPSFSWQAVHRHVHRLLVCLRSIEEAGAPVTERDANVLSSVLATAIRECVAAGYPEAGVALGRWVERRKIDCPLQSPGCVFSTEQGKFLRLPIPLTDSLLSAAIEAFGKTSKSDITSNLIHAHLGDEMPPAKWLLSYHEAVKVLFAQGQPDNAMALFRTIVASGRNPGMFCTAAQNFKASRDWRAILDLYRLALSSGCVSEELGMLAMESVLGSGREKQFPLLRSIIAETARSVGKNPADWVVTNYWALKRALGFSTARLIMGWGDQKTVRLDELELALEVMEKRSNVGLTPEKDVLLSIADAAANFDQLSIPFNKTGIAKVPRDRQGWVRMLERALEEARDTILLYDSRFIDNAAVAFERLGCNIECVEIVNAAILRGLRLRRKALESAVRAAEAEGIEDLASDIAMLLADD